MEFDRAALEKEICSWGDRCGFVMPDRTQALFERLFDDAIRKVQSMNEKTSYAVMMALIIEQQRLLSLWSK
jgi:hypothetical protein